MGIKHLNRYLLSQCSENAISKKPLAELHNKVVVVDTSIYLYKFVETGALIEGFYNMISIFRKYHIVPVFVFDGKPPVEKKELLEKRRMEKLDAEQKYRVLQQQLETGEPEPKEKTEIAHELEMLKKRFVRIKHTDIEITKSLFTSYGVHYIESAGESDQLCAYLVKKAYAWACVSDDMDMFVYGCPRVIRHISLLNHTGVVYDTATILYELNMSYPTFRDLLVLSGTDYNLNNTSTANLKESLLWYDEYIGSDSEIPLYDWLTEHTTYIHDKSHLEKTRDLFDLSTFSILHQRELRDIITRMPFRNREIQHDQLRALLETDGFIFMSKFSGETTEGRLVGKSKFSEETTDKRSDRRLVGK